MLVLPPSLLITPPLPVSRLPLPVSGCPLCLSGTTGMAFIDSFIQGLRHLWLLLSHRLRISRGGWRLLAVAGVPVACAISLVSAGPALAWELLVPTV